MAKKIHGKNKYLMLVWRQLNRGFKKPLFRRIMSDAQLSK